MNETQRKAVASYGRALLAVWAALLPLAGQIGWEPFAWGAVAAVLPPMIRAVNPNDDAFGRVADAIEEAAKGKVSEATNK